MEMLTGTYKADNGKDYYNIALNLLTGEYILIKNASCTAIAEDMALEYFGKSGSIYGSNDIKIFFHDTESELNLKYIPKKYHKYFKD